MTKQAPNLGIGFRYLTILLLFIQPILGQSQCAEQINNFTLLGTYQNSAYYISNVAAQPMEAENVAQSLAANLVSINSQDENDFIQSMIDEMVYIGLNDATSEGAVRWTSNDAVSYTNYDQCIFCNSNDAENDYVIIHPWNGGWSFMNRWSPRRYIIEKACDDSGNGNGGNGNSGNGMCETNISGFNFLGKYEDSNYYLSNNASTWSAANDITDLNSGYLVNIDSQSENDFLVGKFDEMVHIGLSDVSNEGQFVWSSDGDNNFRNFDDNCGFCNDNDSENDFAIIHPWNGEWSLTNRWSQRRYIMEIPCSEDGSGQSLTYTNCPSDRTIQLQQGQTSTVVNWSAPTLLNDCNAGVSSNSLVLGPDSGTDLPAGNYIIRYRALNNCGDEVTCQFRINILSANNNNGSLQFLNCPQNRTIQIPAGQSTAFVNWTPPSANSSCNLAGLSVGLTNGPSNNSNLSEGQYDVEYRASNNCGDVVMCNFTISVINGTNQSSLSINCPQNLNLSIPAGSNTTTLSFNTPIINNVCETLGTTLVQTNGPNRNSQVGAGNYTISYRATNNCNDVAICSFNVSVSQLSGSTITVDCSQEDQTFTVNAPPLPPVASWFFEQPTYDNTCTLTENGGDGVRVSGPNSFNQGSSLSVGEFTAEYTASNLCGDTATCSWIVEVLPSTVPTSVEINCPANRTIQIPQGQTTTLLVYDEPTTNNICAIGPNTVNIERIEGLPSNTTVSAGNYTIRYRATNLCGDMEECEFQITVEGNNGGGNGGGGQVNYTANDQVTPYTGLFRPGTNVGYNPPWTDEEMADLAAGNPALGVKGIGARSMRPGLYDVITAVYGYDFRLETYEHYASLGLEDLTMIVGFPADWHRDQTDYCGNGFNSSMFRNLYTDIWDDGADGTPYNDENFYAAYIYEVVSRYGPYVKFWEIWNEPGFDLTGNRGWRQPGDPAGNWWDNDPDPCEYILRAPIEHYVRTLRISWEIIKTLQPDDYVAVAGVGFVSFLDAILRNTDDPNTGGAVTAEHPLRGGAYFDVMGFHSYPDIDGSVYDFNFNTGERVFKRHSDAAAQGITGTKQNYQDILDNYGYDNNQHPEKEWIITEINVPRKPFRPDAMAGGEEMQINYIIKAVAVAMENEVTQMHVYNLGDRTTEGEAVTEFDLYGLHKRLTGTEAYSQVRNQEAIAYKSAADFVWGSTFDATKTNQMNLPSNLDGVALRMSNGRYKYIIWAKTTIDQSEFASGSYSFPASFGYNQVFRRTWNFTDTDQVQGISSSNISLTGRPIFITETASSNEFEARTNDVALHLSVHDILPNPAVDEIRLVLEAHESDNYNIQIYDATGRLMEQRSTFIQRGFSDERFDISNYVHGMYFVVIQGSLMHTTEVKFIKAEK